MNFSELERVFEDAPIALSKLYARLPAGDCEALLDQKIRSGELPLVVAHGPLFYALPWTTLRRRGEGMYRDTAPQPLAIDYAAGKVDKFAGLNIPAIPLYTTQSAARAIAARSRPRPTNVVGPILMPSDTELAALCREMRGPDGSQLSQNDWCAEMAKRFPGINRDSLRTIDAQVFPFPRRGRKPGQTTKKNSAAN